MKSQKCFFSCQKKAKAVQLPLYSTLNSRADNSIRNKMYSTGKEKRITVIIKRHIVHIENPDYSMEKLLEQIFKKQKLAK